MTSTLLLQLVSHWMACAWMLMARVYLSWYPSEYEQVWWSSANLVPDVDSPQSQYVIAVYYSITIMATIGYGDITPQNGFERTLCIAAMVLGTMCYAYCITQLVEMVAHWHHADVRFKAHQDHLIEYMRARNLPMEVQKRILKFYDFQQRHTAVFYKCAPTAQNSPEYSCPSLLAPLHTGSSSGNLCFVVISAATC